MGKKVSSLRNGLSLLGIPLAAFGFLGGVALIAYDMQQHAVNPYFGVFAYVLIPVVLNLGLLLILIGVMRERRRRKRAGSEVPSGLPVINLNERKQFTAFIVVITVTLCFLTLSSIGAYRTYHFTESVEFCGTLCHEVMEPEYTAFQHSPHANVTCTKCHIGPGTSWYVKSKVNGLYQVYSTLFNKFNRPIEAPVHSLRPADETCYTCHWPSKFFGAVEMRRSYFLSDKANSPWSVQMLIKVGGGDVQHGRGQGIHWHMVTANRIEYVAGNEKRTEIPWVRATARDGTVKIYQTTDEDLVLDESALASAERRILDCIDCHNRPTHQFHDPSRSMNEALATGLIDADLPSIKANGVRALLGEYATKQEAMVGIREALATQYPEGGEVVEQAVAGVQAIYSRSFFPRMKADWREYPDHIGHMITPGCFRCHDGQHATEQGDVISNDCSICHTIIAQGPGLALESITSGGLEFQHPEDIDGEERETHCDECHDGAGM